MVPDDGERHNDNRTITPPQLQNAVHPQQDFLPGDSAVTKAEKLERHVATVNTEEPSSKRIKLDSNKSVETDKAGLGRSERRKGVAPIKAEWV